MTERSTKGADFQLPPKLDLSGPRLLTKDYYPPRRRADRLDTPRAARPLATSLREYSGTLSGDFTCDPRLG